MLETCFPYGLTHAAHVDMSLGKMRGSDGLGKKKAKKDAADASVVPAATTSEGMSAKVDFNAKGVSPEEAERNRRKKILYDAAAYGEVIPRKPADIAKRKAPKGTKPQLTNGEL